MANGRAAAAAAAACLLRDGCYVGTVVHEHLYDWQIAILARHMQRRVAILTSAATVSE